MNTHAHPVQLWLLRLVYALMGFVMAPQAWMQLLQHQGPWGPFHAMALCVWAAYGTLGLLGLLQPLRWLPLVFFMVFYKTLWVIVVALPLWRAGALAGSNAEELAWIFVWAPIVLLAVPWQVGFRSLTGRHPSPNAAGPCERGPG